MVKKFFGNTVCQKSFSDTGFSVKQQIFWLVIKIVNKIMTFPHRFLCGFIRRKSCQRIFFLFRIKIVAEIVKIFNTEYLADVGLGIDGIDNCLFKTVAFFSVDVPAVFAVRTGINRVQIVCRIPACSKELLPFQRQGT